jgi:hypothetical protein
LLRYHSIMEPAAQRYEPDAGNRDSAEESYQ